MANDLHILILNVELPLLLWQIGWGWMDNRARAGKGSSLAVAIATGLGAIACGFGALAYPPVADPGELPYGPPFLLAALALIGTAQSAVALSRHRERQRMRCHAVL